MSKQKSQLIQNIYKKKYFCDENHPLIWKGKLLVYDTSSCYKCGLPAKKEAIKRSSVTCVPMRFSLYIIVLSQVSRLSTLDLR